MIPLLLLALSFALPGPRPAGRLVSGGAPGRQLRRSPVSMTLFVLTAGLAGLIFLLHGQLSTALAGGIAVSTAVVTLRQLRNDQLARRRSTATAAFLGHLLGELRAGAGMPQALGAAAAAVTEEAPTEFRRLVEVTAARTQAGGAGAEVLLDAADSAPELADTAQLWRTAEHHGIPLTPLIEQAQSRLDTRARHRAATSASLQGPQATAVVLTLLPVAGVLMGTAMGADPLGLLFGGGLGGMLLVLGVGLSCSGFLWSRRIITGATR